MSLIDPRGSVLVLVDFQGRLLPAIHGGSEVLARAVLLADAARELGIAIYGTEQNPSGLGPNDEAVRSRCDTILPKMHFNACSDGLAQMLRLPDGTAPTEVVIAGCEAHVCLLQTAEGLLQAGFLVRVVADASGSRRVADHALAMQRLDAAGATIVSTEMVVFEWLETCRHARFRPVLRLLKKPVG
ncbi:MAG TPA: isochorismatase family protein [Lautropia sp.]|jgi:nicotinamidase-related amidase|nr:isochorismatase family protein [Lautropia sp.]